MRLLIRNWKVIVSGILMLLVGAYILGLNLKIHDRDRTILMLQDDIKIKSAYLTAQNILIESNRADYEKKLLAFPMVIREIEKKYYPVTKEIITWRDQNVSHDCNDSIQFINNYAF